MDICKIADMYNEDGLNLEQISIKVGVSRSTLHRRLVANGFRFDRKQGKYILDYQFDETSNKLNNKTINYVNRTYSIPSDLERALKLKSVFEDKDLKELIISALQNFVEKKYFDMLQQR